MSPSSRLRWLWLTLAVLTATPADAARLKDIASIEGVRSNQLSGYGLVAGLNGTGDSQQAIFTVQSVLNMLRRRGLTLNVNPRQLQIKNVAAVSITAALPPFARQGNRIDAQVSSLGDAKSLQGYVDELRELGVEPKGAVEGLVDFPSKMDGRVVYLCWKLGEPEVLFWHDLDSGFGGRQPLTAGSVSGGFEPENESYND